MPYSVHFQVSLETVPEQIRDEIRRTLEDIAEAVGTVSPDSPFWASMDDSLLQIDVKGWRVVYRILRDPQRILALELQRHHDGR